MSSTKKKVGVALVATLTLTTALAGCAPSASSGGNADCEETTSLSIATTPYQDSLIMQVPEALGWYDQACLDVSFVNVSYSAIMSTVSGGQSANVAWNTLDGVITTHHQDPDLAYLYPWDVFTEGNAIMGRADGGLKSAEEFMDEGMDEEEAIAAVVDQWKGKTVVTTSNNVRESIYATLLNSQGKSLDYTKTVDMAPDQGLAVYLQGTGDLYVAGIPQRAKLLDEGYKVLLSGPQIASPSLNGYIVKKSLWEEQPEALLKLINLTFMAIRYTNENLDEVADFVSKKYSEESGSEFTPEQFKEYWNKLEEYPANAAEAQEMIFDESGVGYWKNTWDQSNYYVTQIAKSVDEETSYDAFLGEEVQKAYVDEYGADETGWWEPTGSLQ